MSYPNKIRQFSFASVLSLAFVVVGCGGGDGAASPDGNAALAWSFPASTPALTADSAFDVRGQQDIAPGITLYSMLIGKASPADGFEVNVGFVRNTVDAKPLVDVLAAAGYATKFVASSDSGRTGYAVRLDKRYSSQTEADNTISAVRAMTNLPAASEALAVGVGRVYTAEDGVATSGPFKINLLAIKPAFTGAIRAALATDIVPGRETTSALSQRAGALAAVNGGYFVTGLANGTEGALAGLSVIDGRLVNEGIDGRPALILEKQSDGRTSARIERKLVTTINVSVNGTTARRIDGSNRRPGVTTNCGHAFSVETTVPLHDAVCTNPNDIVVYTRDFGDRTSTETVAQTVEVVIDSSGVVAAVSASAGSAIPPGGQVLQGIGSGAKWLADNVAPGAKIGIERKLTNASNQEITLKPGLWAVNGGPTLLVDGREVATEHAAEGWGNTNVAGYAFSKPNGNRASFFNGFYLRRNPRTAVGIAADGTILMMVSDGRAPTYSAGLSVPETALVMKHFGAVSAINLDGGGSSMMLVNQQPLTLPSDTGHTERADGDALLIFK